MITYKQLERVRKANARLSDNTKKKITEVIERTKPQGEDALRRAILEELAPVMAEADEIAAQMSAAMYNGWRFAALGLTTDTVTQSAYDQKKVEAMANTAAKAVREDETVEAVINIVNGRASYDIRKSYGDTMIANAGRDKHEVRFARIPGTSEHYADGCPFCRMLASRGFVYYSKSTAGEFSHYHDGCTCEPVAQFDKNPKVEGYDPDAYYDEYLAARDYAKSQNGGKPVTAEDVARAYRELGNSGRVEAKANADEKKNQVLEFPDGFSANKYFEEHSRRLEYDDPAFTSFNAWSLDSGVINKYAREETNAITPSQMASAAEDVKRMDKFISESTLKDDITVWRTLKGSTYKDATLEDVYRDRGFTATSVSFDAVSGGVDGVKEGSVWMKIRVPSGSGRGAYINSASEWKDGEFEYLIHRGAEVRIIRSYTDGEGRAIFEGELLK